MIAKNRDALKERVPILEIERCVHESDEQQWVFVVQGGETTRQSANGQISLVYN